MKYDILTDGTGLQFCKYNAKAGVGRTNTEREIFKKILQSNKIDYYRCPNCCYIIIGTKHDILFKDLSMLTLINNQLFLNLGCGEKIEITSKNFSIRCYLNKKCSCPEAWVKEYIPKKYLQ